MASKIWVSTRALCDELGCSDKTIFRLRDEKYLRCNVHWKFTNPTSQRKTYRWHLDRCRNRLEELNRDANAKTSVSP